MTDRGDNIQGAEWYLPSTDLAADLAFYTGTLGFRLDTIFPADDPVVATLSGHGNCASTHNARRKRMMKNTPASPPTNRMTTPCQ